MFVYAPIYETNFEVAVLTDKEKHSPTQQGFKDCFDLKPQAD